MKALLSTLAVILMGLVGCGGEDQQEEGQQRFVRQVHALAAPSAPVAATVAVSPEMVLDWAEYKFPALFPRASVTKYPSIQYGGVTYTARAYAGAWGVRYLGVTPDGRIFGMGDFTGNGLQQFNDVGYWTQQVLGDQCVMSPASCANSPPVAVAGLAQSVSVGSTVTLDGSASSDPNGDAITFQWSVTSRPAGSTATLSNGAAMRPTLVADRPGAFTLSLVVSDGKSTSAASQVTVTAAAVNAPPVANAGATQYVFTGSTVTLDGRGSADAIGATLSFSWILTSRPAGSGAALSGAATARPQFIADVPGTYVATLTISDGLLRSPPSTVSVVATNPAPPVVVVQGLLFGGPGNGTYLGCLTCNQFDLESICNTFGTYGSQFSNLSIWNQFGTYGSQFNIYSPWNQYSTSGPSVIGTDRLFYGVFTTNRFQGNRTTVPAFVNILNYFANTSNLAATRNFACGS